MIVHWTPIRSPHRPEYSQPDPDVLALLDVELDFTNRAIVDHEVPEVYRDYVQRAWRENGVLHLRVLAHYQAENAITVERVIDYGAREVLSWTAS
jgi:hypothetical protein